MFAPDHPLVLDGSHDIYGYTPKERRAQAKARRGWPTIDINSPVDLYDQIVAQKQKGPQMFRPQQPLYLRDIRPGVETVDGETRKTLTLDFLVQPFTRENADDLGIGADLFENSSGEPNDLIIDCKLKINVPAQRMAVRTAPDSPGAHVFDDVEVDNTIKVRADKEGPILAARIKVTLRYPSGDELLFIMSAYTEQLFVTFEQQQTVLPLAGADEKPRKAKKGEEATA